MLGGPSSNWVSNPILLLVSAGSPYCRLLRSGGSLGISPYKCFVSEKGHNTSLTIQDAVKIKRNEGYLKDLAAVSVCLFICLWD